ncbi:MAG TPA: DUF2306 domain-containing protein [Myxococcota bacterium]|jgi:hypothetical protein
MRGSVLKLARLLFLAACAVGSSLITRASVAYFTEGDLHPFVLEKEPLPLEQVWLTALHVHVVAAALALPACLLLVSRWLLRSFPRAHRWLGRVTGAVILCALVPSGAWLALFAKGGLASTAGFLLSGAIVFCAMLNGIRTARARDFVSHRRSVLHVLAQLSVAVTSRALLIAFDRAGVSADAAYWAALWGPVLASAAVVELVTRTRSVVPSLTPRTPRSRHEVLAEIVRFRARPVLVAAR